MKHRIIIGAVSFALGIIVSIAFSASAGQENVINIGDYWPNNDPIPPLLPQENPREMSLDELNEEFERQQAARQAAEPGSGITPIDVVVGHPEEETETQEPTQDDRHADEDSGESPSQEATCVCPCPAL